MTEMHDVVEMLLSRMRDYPEDFYGVDPGRDFVYNKWLEALNTAKQVMTEEEKLIVEAELQAAKRAVYMGAALKTMMSPDEPMEEVINRNQYKHQTSSQLVFSGNGNVGIGSASTNLTSTMANAIQLGNTSLTESELKAIKQYATNNA